MVGHICPPIYICLYKETQRRVLQSPFNCNVNLPFYPGGIRLREYGSRETTELLVMHRPGAYVWC